MSKETEEIFIEEMNSTIKVHPSEYISEDELASIYKEVKTEYEEEGNDLFRDNFSALKTFINEETINQVEKKANIEEEIVKEEITHSTPKQPISNVIKIDAEYISTKPKEEEVIVQNRIEQQEETQVEEIEIVQNNIIEEKEKEVNPVMIERRD